VDDIVVLRHHIWDASQNTVNLTNINNYPQLQQIQYLSTRRFFILTYLLK